MKLHTVSIKSRTAVFCLDCPSAYYANEGYTLTLNGDAIKSNKTNVIALLSLSPAMLYCLKISFEGGEALSTEFVTLAETQLLDVCRFGAVGDGVTDCTAAIALAINACQKGGTVYFSDGVYLSGPIFMKSDITLYLDRNAYILGQTNRDKYPVLPGIVQTSTGERSLGTWEGNPLDCFASLITAIDCNNIVIAGEGTIDGNASNSDWWHDAKRRRVAWRPRTLFFNGCNSVSLVGITVKNSPSWTIHPYYCDNVDILSIVIQNPEISPNTDGCNPENCSNVRIIGAHISVGDDCISFKSGKYYMSCAHYKKSENLLVQNCLLDHGHGAVVLGSEISSGVDNLLVDRCIMSNTDRGLRVKTRRGRGEKSVISNIELSHIVMNNVKTPFAINMFYFCDPDGHSEYVESKKPLPIDKLTPCVGRVYCHDIVATNCQYAGAFFYGLPERPIEQVLMENIHISFDINADEGMPAMLDGVAPMKKKTIIALNVKTLSLKNVEFCGHDKEGLSLTEVEKLIID